MVVPMDTFQEQVHKERVWVETWKRQDPSKWRERAISREAKRGQVILPTYRPQPYSALDEDSIARSRPGYRHPPLPHPPGTEVRGIAFVPKPPPGVVQPAANSSRPHPPNHTAHGNIRRHMRQLRGLFKDPEFGRDARYEHRELRKLLLPSVRGASTSRSSRPRRVRRNLSPSARIDAKTRSHTPPLLGIVNSGGVSLTTTRLKHVQFEPEMARIARPPVTRGIPRNRETDFRENCLKMLGSIQNCTFTYLYPPRT